MPASGLGFSPPANSAARGFTLVELLIVIFIVALLAGIALPGFQDSMRKGRRADAKSGLMDAANRLERYMLDHNSYTDDMNDLGLGADPAISEEGYYSFDMVAATTACPLASCYVLEAVPVAGGAQADDGKCTKFILASTGAKTAEGSAASQCW